MKKTAASPQIEVFAPSPIQVCKTFHPSGVGELVPLFSWEDKIQTSRHRNSFCSQIRIQLKTKKEKRAKIVCKQEVDNVKEDKAGRVIVRNGRDKGSFCYFPKTNLCFMLLLRLLSEEKETEIRHRLTLTTVILYYSLNHCIFAL